MALVLNGDGNVTGLTPGGLPDASITQSDLAAGVAGNGPAFSYSKNVTQTVTNNTWTKVTWSTLGFDTNSNFDTTNYRFKPTVAGYYQTTLILDFGGPTVSAAYGAIYKNGSLVIEGSGLGASFNEIVSTTSFLVYLNGTTDYIEAYGLVSTNGTPMFYGGGATSFQAFLARSA